MEITDISTTAATMPNNSMNINTSVTSETSNTFLLWGIQLVRRQSLLPTKRERSRQIPFVHGTVHFGEEEYYDDRMEMCEFHLTRDVTREELREIIYILQRQNNRLYFWDEPDKYYIANLYDSAELNVLPRYKGANFVLNFKCHSFAHGPDVKVPLIDGANDIVYRGTAPSATLIIIRNPGDTPVQGINISAIERVRH